MDALVDLLDESLGSPEAEAAAPWRALVDGHAGTRAVVRYGSTLWASVRRADSVADLMVVVDDFAWFARARDRLLARLLPPSVYDLDGHAKACVVTAAQLDEATAPPLPDLHLAGRFSKRMRLAWARDDEARRSVARAQARAWRALAPLVLGRLPVRFDLDDFVHALLALSYESEPRVVERGKVQRLFYAEREHYRQVARLLLDELGAVASIDGSWLRARAPAATPAAVDKLLRRSRVRALLRWPKYLATFDGWLDYALAKVARNGVDVRLGPRQRRHPILLGWPELLRIARRGQLR